MTLRRDDDVMRWQIVGGPTETAQGWEWLLARRGRTRTVRVLRSDSAQHDSGRSLVEEHLDDHQPPDVVSVASGWDFERQRPIEAVMGFTESRGARALWTELARRLNLPHWIQPKA